MVPTWWDEVARFVDALDETQRELLEVLRQQRRALVRADAAELERLNSAASDASCRLQQLSAWRARLLEQAAAEEAPAASLSVVLARRATPTAEMLRARLHLIHQRFAEIRREAWVQWIITHRSHNLFADLLELIANGGEKPPTYQTETPPTLPSGGVMLDAAA